MPRKSINELIAQATADFPDNVTGLITPAKLRQFCIDFLNAISPAYGYLTAVGPLTQTLGTTDSLLVFDSAYNSNPAEISAAVPASTIGRAEKGSSQVEINVDFACANNTSVTFTLYKDGAPTIWRVTGTGRGAANPVSVSLTGLDYAAAPAVYDLRAKAETAGTSVELTDMAFLLSIEPVKSFT